MNLKLEIEFSKADVFQRIDALKKQVDDARPLAPDVEGRVMQKLRLDWNYNSNAIEGNKLSYGETYALLSEGVTAKGKPLKDHLDIKGHNAAIDLLMNMVQEEHPLTETDIRNLHEVILGEPYRLPAQTADGKQTTKLITPGVYKTAPNHVETVAGEKHYYATPEETPAKMQELMKWYNLANNDKQIHPIVTAALFHHRFVAIHPFDDGNGRMTRILMNLILMRAGYPVVVIKNDNKREYYSLLRRADVGEIWPFIEFIIERVEASFYIYLKAIKGDNINEDTDIDKEIALFKMELKNRVNIIQGRNWENTKKVFENVIQPLIKSVLKKSQEFFEFFVDYDLDIIFKTLNGETKKLYRLTEDEIANSIMTEYSNSAIVEFLHVFVYFKGFKNSDKSFNVQCGLHIEFNEVDYKAYVQLLQDSKSFKKQYHEELSQYESNILIKCYIDDLKSKILEGLK